MPNKDEQPLELDFEMIRVPFNRLIAFFGNMLDREKHPFLEKARHSALILRMMVLVTQNTYQSILLLCDDSKGARPEFSLSLPPLVRTIFETLFTVIYLFEDLPGRIQEYIRRGCNDLAAKHERLLKQYESDPNWTAYLDGHEKLMHHLAGAYGMTLTFPASPETWFTPKKIKDRISDPTKKEFLTFLNNWFYREMSSDTHLSWFGLIRRGGFFLHPDIDERDKKLLHYQSLNVTVTMTLFLAMLTELEIELQYGKRNDLRFLWRILTSNFSDSELVYNERYKEFLE